jgi:methionyl-tRNA synthetase
MNFIKRILQTKKIKKAGNISKKMLKKLDKKFKVSQRLNKALGMAEDFGEDMKEKVSDMDEKFEVSQRIRKTGDKISETAETIGDRVESVLDEKINFEDFEKIEVRIGEIMEVEKIEKSDKLLKLSVDLGEKNLRQIVSGIAKFYENPEEELLGKQAMFVSNLAPRTIFGHESDGMIFALKDKENFSILSPLVKIKNGTLAG